MKRRGIFALSLLALTLIGCTSMLKSMDGIPRSIQFQRAIEGNDIRRIAKLIKKSSPEEKREGLSLAIRYLKINWVGNYVPPEEVIGLFLEGGVDVNSVRYNKTPLLEACWLRATGDMCDRRIVEFLLKKGADVNAVDGFGQSALRYAVENGSVRIVRLLIQYGADVNEQYEGSTILYTAQVSYKNTEIANILRNAGAEPTEKEARVIQAEKLKKQKEAEIAKLKENLNNFYNEVIHRKGTPIKTGDEFLIGCGCIEVLDRTTTQAGYTYLVTYYPNTDERLAWRDGDVNCFYIVSKKEMTLHQSYFFYDQPFSLNDKEYYTTSLKDLKLTCIGKGKYQRNYQDGLYDVKVGRGIGKGKYQQNYQDVSCYMFSLDAEL